jgi:hypothetical protein
LRNEAFRTSYKDMTVEQFRGLVDAVRNIEHLGRLKKKLLTAQDGRDFAAHVAMREQAIHDNAKKTIPEELEHNTFSSRIKQRRERILRDAPQVREPDAADGRLSRTVARCGNLFIRPLNKAGDFEATRRAQATRSSASCSSRSRKAGKLRQKKFIPEINAKV